MATANRSSAPAPALAAPAIASVRDGGVRAYGFARDLTTYGTEMLALWPELAVDYADGHAMWANFDAGVIDAFDAKTPPVLAVKGDNDAWTVAPEGYVKGENSDQVITAAWCKSRSRALWAGMKKDTPTLYAIASPVRDAASRSMVEARRVLKDGVRKALTGTGRKGVKSSNRTPSEVIVATIKDLQDSIKAWETRKSLDATQAKTIREWLATCPKI
jgi:hypothetical protein